MDDPGRLNYRELVSKSGRFHDPEPAISLLEGLARHVRERDLPAIFAENVFHEALNTADPLSAISRLDRILVMVEDPGFRSLLEDPDGLRSLLAVLGYSNYLSSLILRSPGDYLWLMRDVGLSGQRTLALMQGELAAKMGNDGGADEAMRSLRQNKYREMLRIGVRDLLGAATLVETVHDISNLAEASIDSSIHRASSILKEKFGTPVFFSGNDVRRPGKFTVLGLGKLGGEELNYSSDVDLFYLYSSHEGATTGRLSSSGGFRDSIENHMYFVKMGEMVTRLLNERTDDGFVFRVDLRLRPEGEAGEIAYSLPSLEVFYQSWGRTTDRLALLKAKPVGGFRRLGEEFLELIEPFVFRRYLDYSAFEEIGALKEKIDRHIGDGEARTNDIKLGRGGIREIEFLVQSVQLINGGRNPAVRERNTLRAIGRLMRNGYLLERDAESLSSAYEFLRTVEHRVQLVEERQTHTLPSDKASREKIAFSMGYSRGGAGDAKAFEGSLSRYQGMVTEIYDRTFFRGKVHAVGAPEESVRVLREDISYEEAIEELTDLGFSDPEGSYKNLMLLRDGPDHSHFPETCRELLRQIAPRLMEEVTHSPDPDAVLTSLERFVRRVGARASYYALLASNPESIRLLVTVFGFSRFLSGLLISQPDLLDLMVSSESLHAVKSTVDMESELVEMLRPSPSFEDELIMMRKFRNGEILRIGLGDLLGLKEIAQVNRELSELAEVIMKITYPMAIRDAAQKGLNPGKSGKFAILALGKMGGMEINYSSDLDLIFLYDGEESAREFYTWAAQRMITILSSPTGEGLLYRIDMRLRPSGHAGPLVTRADSFERYQREEAMVWEHQALIKARCIAGDGEFMARITSSLDDQLYSRALEASEVAEIRRVRDRMENELSAEAGGNFYDVKVGRGGLVDIEFAVQVMQLYYGHDHSSVRDTSTLQALEKLHDAGLVEDKLYNTFRRAYFFYRGVENRQHIYKDRSDPRVYFEEERLRPLVRRMGFTGSKGSLEKFLENLNSIREEVREGFDKTLDFIEKNSRQ